MDPIFCAPLAFDPILVAFPTPVPTPTPSPPMLSPSPSPILWPQSQPPQSSAPPATIMTSALLPPMSLDPYPALSVTVVNVQAMPAGGIYYAVPNDRGSIRQGRKRDF